MNQGDLLQGVEHVKCEWTQMAGCAARLERVDGIRTPEQNATLEALLLHARCLINFLCGDHRGKWRRTDMKPADFLRVAWVLPEEEMDRRLRGRLPVINKALAHLSWERVTSAEGVIWPTGLVAHEIHWAMHKLVDAVREADVPTADRWLVAAVEADRWMPVRRTDWRELRGFDPAPERQGSPHGPVVLDDGEPTIP